jgi:hypothetical protein
MQESMTVSSRVGLAAGQTICEEYGGYVQGQN